jgi:hypothetical protein
MANKILYESSRGFLGKNPPPDQAGGGVGGEARRTASQ